MQYHAALIKELCDPKAIAAAAGARRIVEREQARLQIVDRVAATRAGVACRKKYFLALIFHRRDGGNTVSELQCGLEGLGQTEFQVLSDFKTIDDHIDSVLPFFIQRWHVIKVHHNAVDTDTNKTRSAHLFKNMQVLPFSIAHDGRQEHQFAAFR